MQCVLTIQGNINFKFISLIQLFVHRYACSCNFSFPTSTLKTFIPSIFYHLSRTGILSRGAQTSFSIKTSSSSADRTLKPITSSWVLPGVSSWWEMHLKSPQRGVQGKQMLSCHLDFSQCGRAVAILGGKKNFEGFDRLSRGGRRGFIASGTSGWRRLKKRF